MRRQKLGKAGPEIPVIGLGCMPLTSVYGTSDKSAALAVIDHALEAGVTHLDSSDAYAAGTNEELLGEALKGRRDKVFLATKFGQIRHAKGMDVNGRPDYVQSACEASLRRLGVDVIDLYYQHRVDPDTPIEDTVGAMARLVEQGKVRTLGLSEAGADTIRRGHATHPIAALQTEYSLWSRFAEDELLPLCNDLGIAYVAYSPVGRGFLSAAIKSEADVAAESDSRKMQPRFQGENLAANVALLETLEDVAAANACSPAQAAIAWVLARGDYIFPIPGTMNVGHMSENAAAADIELSSADLARLADAFRPEAIAGTRYPEGHMSRVGI